MNRVYISLIHEFPKNVISSQVVEYLELFDKSGLNFNMIFLVQIGEYVKGFKTLYEQRDKISKMLKGSVRVFPVARDFRFASFAAAVIILIPVLFKYRKAEKIVIHSRGMFSAWVASAMKKIYHNIEYVYDIRADITAEFEYHAVKSNLNSSVLAKRKQWFDKIIQIALDNSAKVFCVSAVLKNTIAGKYKIDSEKISVIPCLADSSRFNYQKGKGHQIRKLLGLKGEKVFIYSGGMGYWHCSEKIFEIIGKLMSRRNDIFYLILTPNGDLAKKYADKYLPENKFKITNAGRDEVGEYLSAADIALLLRENHPLNQVAAPTKFAEYIMSGLPVIISNKIGDYSSFVYDNNFGIVINDLQEMSECVSAFNAIAEEYHSFNREKIAAAGYDNFAKIKYADMMCSLYRSL